MASATSQTSLANRARMNRGVKTCPFATAVESEGRQPARPSLAGAVRQ